MAAKQSKEQEFRSPSGTMHTEDEDGRSDGRGMTQQVGNFAEELKSHAIDAAMPLKDKAREAAQNQKNILADRIDGFAKAIDAAGQDLATEAPMAGEMLQSAAGSVKSASQSLRENSVDEMTAAVSRFARTQPLALFAGAVVTGIALSRFLKSSSRPEQ